MAHEANLLANLPAGTFVLGVLGGSGLYDLTDLADLRELSVDTPFGAPSGPIVLGRLGTTWVAFLARHGRGHRFSPSEVNFRANIHALKQVGVQRVLSISAVGSLRETIVPGDLVLVDQFIDKTHGRASTFFGDGIVGHVSFAEPTCAEFGEVVAASALDAGLVPASFDGSAVPRSPRLHRGGTYVCMEGPQFSTRAESNLHRAWGADVIGMTAATEAKLAREAELCFSLLALSTDFDCWRTDEEPVTADAVMAVLRANIERARAIIVGVAARATPAQRCRCGRAAAHAIFTARDAVSPQARTRLQTLYGRYL
ncbi:MAG TPA: S-methyl-5'-thioadenosine phosphorylase [Polyangia bacterium]|nr:S-methyl-5'-thioadenosine phosphorylase [Polyangia bacterium]